MATQLCINIGKTSAQFAEVLRSTAEVLKTETFTFNTHNEKELKEELNNFVKSHDFLKEYTTYSLAYWGEKFTLVPFNLFDSKNYEHIFALCFGKENFNKNTLSYTMQPHLGVSALYELPNWLKSFFIIKYPRVIIQHGICMQLNGINTESNFKPNIYLHLEKEYVFITLFNQTKLVFSNQFDYQGKEDIIYHLLHVVKKIDIENKKGLFTITGDTDSINVENFASSLKNYNALENFTFEIDTERTLKHHLLCV